MTLNLIWVLITIFINFQHCLFSWCFEFSKSSNNGWVTYKLSLQTDLFKFYLWWNIQQKIRSPFDNIKPIYEMYTVRITCENPATVTGIKWVMMWNSVLYRHSGREFNSSDIFISSPKLAETSIYFKLLQLLIEKIYFTFQNFQTSCFQGFWQLDMGYSFLNWE